MSAKRKNRKNSVPSLKSKAGEKLIENSKNEDSVKTETPDFSDILHRKWKVFRVSPIFNFLSSKLQLYGKKMSEELNARREFDSDVTYHCSFTLNEKLRLDDESVAAIQVEVINNKARNVYLGYFISWGCDSNTLQNFVSLPVLLMESKDRYAQKVHSTFCKMFDCDIQPVTFSLHALATFFVKFLESPYQISRESQEGLFLEYKVPGCGPKDSIKVSLVVVDTIVVLAVIIDNLREKVPGISNMEIILEFYKRILNHIYKVYEMDLMMAELTKVVLPYASVTSDGQLKINSNELAVSVLGVLQQFTPLDAVLGK